MCFFNATAAKRNRFKMESVSCHSDIAETDPFFDLWKQVTLENYHELKDFRTSGLGSAQWPSLFPVKTEQLMSYYEQFAHKAYQ